MRVNSLSGSNCNYSSKSPSFGMAKLTQKGTEAVTNLLGTLPQYVDTTCYSKKGLLKGLIKKSKKVDVNFTEFFRAGNTEFPYNNKLFAKKQILPMRSMHAIKRFLKKQSGSEGGFDSMSDKGKELVIELINLFDKNLSNPELSSKEGRKILNLVEPYIQTDEFAARSAIVSSRKLAK